MKVVLYVENNPNDALLVQHCTRRYSKALQILAVEGLGAAKNVLLSPQGPAPAAILLDFNLDHGETGLDLVRWVRGQPPLSQVPVIMYSGGESEDVIHECYSAGS